jgi:hypothetical protein
MKAKYEILKDGKLYKIMVTDEEGFNRGFLHSFGSKPSDKYWRKKECAERFLEELKRERE